MPMQMVADDNNNNNNNFFHDIDDPDWILEKPISVFALDPADRRVLKVADQRDTIQKKTFTKWVNFHLSKRNGLYVEDLYLDLRDGQLLISLLEIFTNQIIIRERGISKFHALRNIEQCLQCLEQDHNIRLVNIRPEELANGNPKLTLGLIWRIILHFQFADIILPPLNDNNLVNSQAIIPTTEPASKPIKISPEKTSADPPLPSNYRHMLLIWARQQCQDYPGISIENLTRSWRDGRAFLAILHRHNPQLINIKQIYRCSNRENLTEAFQFAHKHYGITQLIDPEDIDTDEPDEKSILLYITHLYKVCRTLPIHPFQEQHDRIHRESELTYEYKTLAWKFFKWLKTKLDLLNSEKKLENILHDDLPKYHRLLHRLQAIDTELQTLQFDGILQPEIDSINSAWNELEITINRMEKYEKLKMNLDLIEYELTNIEVKDQFDHILMNEIQIKLDEIRNHCQILSLSNGQTNIVLKRINELHLRINNHFILTNGLHQASEHQTFSPQPSNSTNSPTGIEQLNIFVTENFRQDNDSPQHTVVDSAQLNTLVLLEELRLIDSNLNGLDELLQRRLTHLLQIDLPIFDDDLLVLYNQHKDYENDLLSQASRIKDIRNHVRKEYNSSSHQELRSLVNQTSDHVQNLFTTSKTYSDKLNNASNLTSQLLEIEMHLASQQSLTDDLNEVTNRLHILEKSISELLKQPGNEKLISKWKELISEVNQRKRSIAQINESHRSFEILFDQEERILNNYEKRIPTLEPISNDRENLRRMEKNISILFNEILSRAQAIEHMNDVAVKFIEEVKMHDKNLKHFCISHSISPIRRSYVQHASRTVLNKVELFDRRYANLVANMEEYTRLFVRNYNATGQIINLPIESASTIVHLYRSTIASRYNINLESIFTADDGKEQSFSSSSTKRYQQNNNNKTGFIDLSRAKATFEHRNYPLSSVDGSISLETTYLIPATELPSSIRTDNDPFNNKKVRFIVQKQQQQQHPSSSFHNDNIIITSSKSNTMTQRKNLSFVDAVNGKHLDLSTGLFSSPFPFVLSSSSFSSSSTSSPAQHRHPHNHFSSSSSSPPHTTTTITDNKNLLSTSPLSVNNHPPPVGTDSAITTTNTKTTITLKEAIDANILDARSAYVVDTLEQRNYDLREAYSRGLINLHNHHIIDRATSRQLNLADGLKMGILKVGDPQPYNIISKTESLIISNVFDHRLNTFIDPNLAIRSKILDPYHGLYLNNLTNESISIDDAMTKGFVTVEQQSNPNPHQHNDKYVISTSLIRETRSYHLLGVKDYINNKELNVQEAIRAGILDKQNGQYINKKTGEIFSISEAISQGHIRAQPLPVESTNQETTSNATIKRGTVKETKTYTLKSAIHPKTRQEIPIRLAIDEGIIDHAKGFYVNSLTGEQFPISVAIEKGLIFTELIDQHPRRFVKTLIIEQILDPVTNRHLGVTEAIQTGLLNSIITIYYHPVTQKQISILEAYEQGLIIGKFRDQHPSTFCGDQHEQVFYLITGIIDIRNDKMYNLQEGIQQKLFDHKKGVYLHPITGDEMNIGEAVKRGFIQVQAVSSQIIFNNTDQILTDKRRAIISQEPYGNTNDSRSKLSIRIESQSRARTPYEINESESLQREKDVIEIESIQRLPRHNKKQQHITREEEIIEKHTTNILDREVFMNRNGINRGRSNERQKQQYIEEVIIDDGINNNRRAKFDIKEDRHTSHREIVIEGERYVPPPPPKDQLIINRTHREHEVRVVPSTRPQPPLPSPRPVHIDDRQREGQRIHHGELIIDDHQRPHTSSSTHTSTTTKEYLDITDNRSKISPTITSQQQTNDSTYDEHQSWTEEEWDQWHCIMMIKGEAYRVVWVMNTATGDCLPLQNASQRGLVDTKQRLFFDEKLNRQSYSFEKAVELGYMGIEPDTASLPIHVDGIDYMIHWVLDSSTKRRIFPRQAIRKQILDAIHGRYMNPYNNSQVSLHEAIYLKFIGATEYNSTNDSLTITMNGETYTIKWVYDTRNMTKILPRDALKQGILDIQLNEYRKFDTNDVMNIYDAMQAGYIRCSDDDSSSDNSIRPPSIISIDEDELTIATKTATYVITSVIHPLTQKEIKVSEAIDLGILDKEIGTYRDLVTNVQYELAEAINEGLVYATIIETKEDTEMMTSSVQEIIKKFIVKSVCVDSESKEKIGGLEAQAIGILNYAQGVYHDRKYGVKIPLDKAIEKKLLDVELVSQRKFEEYDLELITDTITERRITLYKIHGVRNNVLDRMESGAVAIKNQMIDTEAKTYTDFSTGETMPIQEAINRKLVEAEISEHVERKPLGLSMQNAIRLGFYVAETGTFRDSATEHYMTLMEAIERGHIHVNGVAFADSEQGPITLYDAFSLGLINRRDGGKLNPAKMSECRARLVESKLHRMNVEDAIRCGLLNLRTGFYKHPHSGEQLNLKEAIQRGLIDGQSTVIEHPTSGRFMTLKEALDGIRIDNEGQVIDSYSNKTITTLEIAFNHRKLFSQFDVNAGEVFLPAQNESVGFEKAIRKHLLDNNRMKLFDPKTSREYTIQDAIERGLIDAESGLVYDSHSHTQYSIREAIRHGIVAIVGAPLVPIKADHETVAAKITSRKHRRHSLVKSSLHYDYNSALDSADEDSHGSGWHRITSKPRAISPLSADGTSDLRRNIRQRNGSSPTRTCRDDDWKTGWKNGHNDDDDDEAFGGGGGGGGSRGIGNNSFYSSTTTRTQQNTDSSNPSQGGRTSSGFQQKQEQISTLTTISSKDLSLSIDQNSNELIEHKYEVSYYIPISTKVSNEPSLSAKTESITSESTLSDKPNDVSLSDQRDTKEILQNDDNHFIRDMHDVATRLTSLHNQLNQYVYLCDNLDELRANVEQIKILYSGVEKEKVIIDQLAERTRNVNSQLAIVIADLEEKRIEIADINNDLCNIIERFIIKIDHFNTEHARLTAWLEINDTTIQKNVTLSTLDVDNEKFKIILNTGINLQIEMQSLQEHLHTIDSVTEDFEQITDNTDAGKSIHIFKPRFEFLSVQYSNFVKHCKQISDQCEHYLSLFNEINDRNEEFLKTMNEFDQHLENQENDNTLQSLLLNVQQQLDKLGTLAIHEPSSPSNNSIHNELKEYLCTLLDSHTERYDNAQKRLMHHFELIERFLHERQTIKERINELYDWLLISNENDLFFKPLSLKRSKLDEQIINFRQFHAQLRTRRYSFDTDINTTINLGQLLDSYDKKALKSIEKYFQSIDQRANLYNENINRLSTRLNEFHHEHAHLIDNYSKQLRLYSEDIQKNDDENFSILQLLLNNNDELIIDHTLYEQLINDLFETDNVEDQNEIDEYKKEVNEYRNQYEKLQNDLKIIFKNRKFLFNQYELVKNEIQEWLVRTDRLLKQQTDRLTMSSCQQLLIEYLDLPIDQLKSLTEQLIHFYSSSNLLNIYEQLKLPENINTISRFQEQTDELIENYLLIKQRMVQSVELFDKIQQLTNTYQLDKQNAEYSIEKAKELITFEENIILLLDNQQIEIILQKYKTIADQLKSMSSTIDVYKTSGLTLINTAQRYIDTDSIQNEIVFINKSWGDYVEYILDTLDYIQLHQDDLNEFSHLAQHLLSLLDEKQLHFETINNNELKNFQDEIEKIYEQVELLNQKGEFLLQSSATNLNEDNDNQVEILLETINRNYDSLTVRIQVRLDNQSTRDEEILSVGTNELTKELHHHVDEIDLAMNELSELLITSTTDTISAQPIKLNEQLIENSAIQCELEKRRSTLEQLQINMQTVKQMMTDQEDMESIKALDEKLILLNGHWLIMKQANDLREENLLLTEAYANQFWSQHNQLSTFLNTISNQLSQIHPRSISREHIQHEQEKYNKLSKDFSNNQIKFREIFEEHSLQLLTLISNNQQETEDIQRCSYELEQQWNQVHNDLNICQNELSQAMIKLTEFNSKLERVSTWFDDTLFTTTNENKNELERIRTFKEHLDCKYIDIVNLKQDYTDIEQNKQAQSERTVQFNGHKIEDKEKTNLVEEQLITIDSKWNQLNDKMKEHKTLIYETALRQDRVGDVIADITRSLDTCTSKLSGLIDNSSNTNLNDTKQIEISIAKLRILLNDIELISYDIEQLKQSDSEDKQSVQTINNRWEKLLKQTAEKYNFLEIKLEQIKFQQNLIDSIHHELDLINKQITESTINTKFISLIQRVENIEEQINKEFINHHNNEQIEELKKRLTDVKQRTLKKGQELIDLTQSIELFHKSLEKFTERLTSSERYLNRQKAIQRRFGLLQKLLKQIDEHKLFQIELQTYQEHFTDLDKLATHLIFVSSKNDSVYLRNSLITVQTRWQRILTRTIERTKELQKAFQLAKQNMRPIGTDIDRVRSEVHRQTSLCQCSKKYDVQQIAEGRYRFGESQSLRLVRILRSTVMVRVGGGWTALDEYLVRHDPCRGRLYDIPGYPLRDPKGRTNYELHPEAYALRDGVAQTMTLFKPRLVTVHRPTCLFHQQQLAGTEISKQSPVMTPIRPLKSKSRRTSSTLSLIQQQPNSLSNGDLSISGDDLSVSSHILSDSETKPSHIPIPISMCTPSASTISRTSSRESILSEHSSASISSSQQHRRPSKLPLPISRHKKNTNS